MKPRLAVGTRAVLRPVEPAVSGVAEFECPGCDGPVKFTARKKLKKVVANIYEDDAWDRVEQWHADCYQEAGEPYGEAS